MSESLAILLPETLPPTSKDNWLATPISLARRITRPPILWPDHLHFLARRLATVFDGKPLRLIVQMPPRHGKSETASHWFPVWALTWRPQTRIILASYEADFASMWGRKVRNTMNDHAEALGVELTDDSSAANRWETSAGGGMVTAGVGGPITGRGADILLVDDPVKNAEEAGSQTYRDRAWEWWQTTAYTRLEPGGSAILIMTRWHEDDLAGRLIAGGGWEVISFPAIAGSDGDDLGRKPGEALWPQRYDVPAMASIRAAVGSHAFSALYQQRPTPAGGGLFKRDWFRYYGDSGEHYSLAGADGRPSRRVLKSECWRFITCDLALTTKTYNDYSVYQVWDVERVQVSEKDGVCGGAMFLVEQWRERQEAPYVEDALRAALERFRPLFIGVEDNSNFDTSVIQRFRRDGLPVRPVKPDRDKITRATTASVWMENQKICFPRGSPWLDLLEHEILAFPSGEHDDMVDCLAYAAIFANAKDMWIQPPAKKLPPGSIGTLLGHDRVLPQYGGGPNGDEPFSASEALARRPPWETDPRDRTQE